MNALKCLFVLGLVFLVNGCVFLDQVVQEYRTKSCFESRPFESLDIPIEEIQTKFEFAKKYKTARVILQSCRSNTLAVPKASGVVSVKCYAIALDQELTIPFSITTFKNDKNDLHVLLTSTDRRTNDQDEIKKSIVYFEKLRDLLESKWLEAQCVERYGEIRRQKR